MKRYTPQVVKALPLANASSRPKPFPGKWPTRVYVNVMFYNKTSNIEYIGKPNKTLFQKIADLRATAYTISYIHIFEFDKGRRFKDCWVSQVSFSRPTLSPNRYDISFCTYYYGLSGSAVIGWDVWSDRSYKLFHKNINVDGKIHRVYSELEKLKVEQHINPYKNWVRSYLGGNSERIRGSETDIPA